MNLHNTMKLRNIQYNIKCIEFGKSYNIDNIFYRIDYLKRKPIILFGGSQIWTNKIKKWIKI